MPVIGVWVWGDQQLQSEGYKELIDEAGIHSPYNLLVSFLQFPDEEVVNDTVYDQVKLAARYASEHNLGLAADLDIR